MKTKQISLRDNTINFEREIVDEQSIKSLSMEHLVALVAAGAASWDWRAGAKPANDGKVFSLADIGKDLATVKSKDGEPLPADKELATSQIAKFTKLADAEECPDELTGEDAKKWYLDKRNCLFLDWADAQAEKHGFDYETNGESLSEIAPRFMRARRLAIARNVAKAAKAGLSDLD